MKHLEDTPWWICDPEDTNYCAYVDTDSNYFHAEPLLRHRFPNFNEKEEKHFRKMLQQGGSLKIKGNKFKINKYEYKQRNSKGEFEEAAKPHRPEDWE